jgi:cold shock CspA family protein
VKEGDEATSEATHEAGEDDAEEEEITLMLRNLPCRLGHDDLVAAIDGVGLAGEYDFLHLPAGLRGKYPRSMGYAFVHFKTVEQAATFAFRFRDFRFQGTNSNKSCTVDLASMQGYKSHKRPIANKAQVQQKAFQKAVMRMVASTQLPMSTPGTIKQFFPAKGFGFIQPDAGGDSVFFHVHHNGGDDAFADVTAGDRVMYDATWDERRGKDHAINVTGATITLSIAGSRPLVPPGFSAPGCWDASGGKEGLGPEMSAWPGEHWMPGAGLY